MCGSANTSNVGTRQALLQSSNNAPVAQLDRVPGYEPGGREFESLRARQMTKGPHRGPFFICGVLDTDEDSSSIKRASVLDARSAPRRGEDRPRRSESISPGAPNDKGSPSGALFHLWCPDTDEDSSSIKRASVLDARSAPRRGQDRPGAI